MHTHTSTIHLCSYLLPSVIQGEEIFEDIKLALDRGVKVRIVQDSEQEETKLLAKLGEYCY